MHHQSLTDEMYRCVLASRSSGWAPLSVMMGSARWNPSGQAAVYAAFEPDVAEAEKMRHITLAMGSALFVALGLWTGKALSAWPVDLAIVAFDPFVTTTSAIWDGRGVGAPSPYFQRHMRPGPPDGDPHGYDDPQLQGYAWARGGCNRIIVPSYPFFGADTLRWTNVFYLEGYRQPAYSRLPALRVARSSYQAWAPVTP